MRALEFLTGHMIYNLAYKYLNLIDDNHPELSKLFRLELNHHLSNYLAYIQHSYRILFLISIQKDCPLVETQVNSALGQINVIQITFCLQEYKMQRQLSR